MTGKPSTQYALIESYVQSHLDAWKEPSGKQRQWDRIKLRFVDDPKISAAAFRFPSGEHEIRIGRNLIYELQELIEKCWGKVGNLSDDNHSWQIRTIIQYSVLLVYYHEFAHVVRGHLFELARKTKKTSAQFNWGETSVMVPKGCIHLTRWMERDADIVGADYFAMLTALPHWRKKSLENRKSFARFCLTAAAAVCVQIERLRQDEKCSPTIYDPPYLRWLTFIESLGAGLVRELELEDEHLYELVAIILSELQSLPELTGLSPELWALEDMKQFKKESRRHSRVIQSYLHFQEKFLASRSSFLPDVGPDQTREIQETVESTVSSLSKLENSNH